MNCSQKLISLILGTTGLVRRRNEEGCELLSKVDIFDIRNNQATSLTISLSVVNCSQKLISLIFGTTPCLCSLALACCELLSKVDIFDIRNNKNSNLSREALVVNCSQKLISLIFGTTAAYRPPPRVMLWIALKSWYLWYSEQRDTKRRNGLGRCELLSKVDIFDIRNNDKRRIVAFHLVVNCSQKLISLIFGTTRPAA